MAAANPTKPTTRKPAVRKPAAPEAEVIEAEIVDEESAPTPSESVDEQLDQDALRAELLADMPELLPAHRLRARARAGFDRLMLHATVGKVFRKDGMLSFNLSKPADVERYDAFLEFVSQIDEWAETIAIDPEAYADWSAGKDGEVFMALFMEYQRALGESRGSAN